jgi:hypothetical protein
VSPDTIRQRAEAEARRIAYEREIDGANIPRMTAAMIHTAMMRELEPYHRMKSRVMATIVTPGYAVRADGGLEPLPLEIPEVLRPGLAALDEAIAGIADAHREAIAATLGPFTPAELVLMNEAHRLTRIGTIA